MLNPFASREAAARYRRGRPYHHERTLDTALRKAPQPGRRALDVGCGTGLSTRALRALGFDTAGVDSVPAMISIARDDIAGQLLIATAEAMPFADASFDLVAVGSAVHWFDQDAFVHEVARVTSPGAVLLVSDHGGLHIPSAPAFTEWIQTTYSDRYPSPPRAPRVRLASPVLVETLNERWIDADTFDHKALVTYLLTQSNVADAIDSGRESESSVADWLRQQTAPFFPGGDQDVAFVATAIAWRVTHDDRRPSSTTSTG